MSLFEPHTAIICKGKPGQPTEFGRVLTWRERQFPPQVTLWAFLWQVLSADGSWREAVTRVWALRVAHGQVPPSPNTGSYGKVCATATAREPLLAALYGTIAAYRVGQRPDRVEPRAVKRRPKPHALSTVPRDEARRQLLQGRAA